MELYKPNLYIILMVMLVLGQVKLYCKKTLLHSSLIKVHLTTRDPEANLPTSFADDSKKEQRK